MLRNSDHQCFYINIFLLVVSMKLNVIYLSLLNVHKLLVFTVFKVSVFAVVQIIDACTFD